MAGIVVEAHGSCSEAGRRWEFGALPPRGDRRIAGEAGVHELPAGRTVGPMVIEGPGRPAGRSPAPLALDSELSMPGGRGAALPLGGWGARAETGIRCGRAVVTVRAVRVVSNRGLPFRAALYATVIAGGRDRKTLWRWNRGGESFGAVGVYPVDERFTFTFAGPTTVGIEGFVSRKAPARSIRTLEEVVAERYPPWELWPWRGLSEGSLGPEVEVRLPPANQFFDLVVALPAGHLEVDLRIEVEELPRAGSLRIAGVEVTQAIQHLWSPHGPDNSLPLVAGKLTLVRVFVEGGMEPTGAALTDVSGQVTAFYPTGNVELRRALNQPFAGTQPVTTAIDRGNWTHSLNFFFEAPAEDVGSGVVAFLCQVERAGQTACQQVRAPFVTPPPRLEIVVCPFSKLDGTEIAPQDQEDLDKVRRRFVGELEPGAPQARPFEGCMHSLFPAPRDFVTLVDGGRVRHEANLRTGIDWLALLNLLVVHATPKLPPEEVALALLLIGLFGFTFEGVVGQVGGMAVPRKLSPRRIILGTFPEALSHLNGFSVPSSPAVAAPPRNYAHEVAHVLGLQHACDGEFPDKGFIPRDCAFSEVGVDVFHAFGFCLFLQGRVPALMEFPFLFSTEGNRRVVDFMAKPEPRPNTEFRFWITPYHWVRLLRALTAGSVDLNVG